MSPGGSPTVLEERAAELLPEAVFRYVRQGARDGTHGRRGGRRRGTGTASCRRCCAT